MQLTELHVKYFESYHGLNGCASLLVEGQDLTYNMLYKETTNGRTNKTKKDLQSKPWYTSTCYW